MFRRTTAMLTREFPGSEIAVGMQLKHVATRALANTTTQGCTEPSPAWAQHLRTAISERRLERLAELFAADGRGEPIGYGPGADRLRGTFAAIRAKAAEMRATDQAQHGDLRVGLDNPHRGPNDPRARSGRPVAPGTGRAHPGVRDPSAPPILPRRRSCTASRTP
jgi:hypothetical protein